MQVIDLILDALARHYELPVLYEEPRPSDLVAQLDRYLSDAWQVITANVTLIEPVDDDPRLTINGKIGLLPINSIEPFSALRNLPG
jgi:hypothetical protein